MEVWPCLVELLARKLMYGGQIDLQGKVLMGAPKVIAVSNISHGEMQGDENVITEYGVGDELPNDKFTDEEFQALIACQSAVDTSGELQTLTAVPFVDTQTEERDKLLRQAGLPTLVDTRNPMNRGIPDMQNTEQKTLEQENARLKDELSKLQASQAPKTTSGAKPSTLSSTKDK